MSASRFSIPDFCRRADDACARPRTVLAVILVWSLILLAAQLLKHYAFESNAFDLRLHEELVRNTWHGKFMYSDLAGSSFLPYHVSLIFPVLALLYPLWPGPVWLLVIQGALVAGAAWFLWGFARDAALRPLVAFSVVVTFLTYDGLLNGYFQGFHQEVIAVFFLLGFFRAVQRRRAPAAFVFALFALFCREDFALPLAVFGAMLACRRESRGLGVAVCALCVGWLVAVYAWVIPQHSASGQVAEVSRWARYGTTYGGIVCGLLAHPFEVLGHLVRGTVDPLARLFYLPVLDPWTLLPALLPLTVHTSSSFRLEAHLGAAYATLFVPFFFTGLVRTLARPWFRRRLSRDRVALAGCLLLVLVNLQAPPHPKTLAGAREAHRGLARINADLAGRRVLAQGSILPHLGWPLEYAMIGARQAKPPDHYDLILLGETLNPWPLQAKDIAALKARLLKSGSWEATTSGSITCFRKKTLAGAEVP